MSLQEDREPVRASEGSRAERLLSELAALGGISAELPPVEAVRHLLRRAVAAIGAGGGSAHVVDALGGAVDVVEGGAEQAPLEAAAEAIARGEEAWLHTAPAIDARSSGTATHGSRALAVLPIQIGGKSASVVLLWFDEKHDFPESERSFLRAFARVLSQAVDRASLRVQQREADRDREKRARWADALSEAFRLIASPASLASILDELARVSCQVPADFSAIRVLCDGGQSLRFRGLYHRDPSQGELLRCVLAERVMPASLGQTARVLENGKSLLLPRVDMDRLLRDYAGTPFGEYAARFPLKTVMVVPLRTRGEVFGVVTVARSQAEPFEEADLRFVEEVADRAAVALESANLLQKLAHSEEKLRVALEAGKLGAWDWDIPAQQVTWSTMLEKIHGLAPGSFAGTFEAYQRDIHPEDRERVLLSIARVLEERTSHHALYRIVLPDGELRWLEAHGTLLCGPTGTPQRMIGVCLDVTERRKSEEQLRETMQALRDADQRKDHFLALLAHELRNPLGALLNATHLLGIPGLAADSAMRARRIIDRQVRHMARLLDDLLDVSRITRGKIALLREAVDMVGLAREVAGDHLESFRAAGLALELEMSAEPLFVYADRTRIAQVIGNLLSNALKFSERGQSVRVRVDGDASGNNVVLTIRDEGSGIEPGLVGRMFEPFVQADTSLAHPRGGLGLGLAVVKGLVNLHGGCVSASSQGLGHGAELRVELPRLAAHPEVAESREDAPEAVKGSARVLVFEDNTDAAETLRVILSDAGYRVWVESTGRRATELVKSIRPDVVLCDVGLPDRDGYTIASDIRSDPESAALPLIAITGYGAVEDQTRSRRAGFDLHLTKPVPPAHLLSELSRLIVS
jgi:PAS domain S-box-containing protein